MPVFGKRRALGQHFLKDPSIIGKIVSTALDHAERSSCRALLEVGPGGGALTRPLLERLAKSPGGIERVILAERDRALAARWREHIQGHGPPLVVHEGDFLDLSDELWLERQPLAVVSNLPYSAGTAILQRLARHPTEIPFMVLMFQAEVAARLRAEPGTKSWGSLSVWIQNVWDVRKLCAAPPGAFAPPPDVDSEVVVLERRPKPRIQVSDPERWEALLTAGFAHRRKMLRSGLPSGMFKQALERSGIDPTLRAEALDWDQWDRFYRAIPQ